MHGINNKDLSKFVNDIVFIGYDAYIQGLVSFAQPVYIEEEFIIESDLWCDTIMGIDVRDWPKRAVTLDAGKIHGKYLCLRYLKHYLLQTDLLYQLQF